MSKIKWSKNKDVKEWERQSGGKRVKKGRKRETQRGWEKHTTI
jgi:hypothetical protein